MYPRLRDLREDSNLTQTEIAKLLNVDQRTYSNYENGIRDLPMGILVKIADYFHTSTDYLLRRTNNPTPYRPKKPI